MGVEPIIGSLSAPTMHFGGLAGMQAVETVARTSSRRLSGDIFRLTDSHVADAFRDAWARGGEGSILISAHPESFLQLRAVTAGSRVRVAGYGGVPASEHPPLFIHSKTLVADRSEGLVGTVAVRRFSRTEPMFDVTGTFRGPAAAALDDMVDAAVANDAGRMRETVLSGARQGILANDPVSETHTLSQAMEHLLRFEDRRLFVVTKALRDPGALELLEHARLTRRIPVTVGVGNLPPEVEQRLRSAGVEVLGMERPIHGNLVYGEGQQQVVWGSAHLTPRAYGARETDGFHGNGFPLAARDHAQRSREVGATTRDAAALREVERNLESLPWRNWEPEDPEMVRRGILGG